MNKRKIVKLLGSIVVISTLLVGTVHAFTDYNYYKAIHRTEDLYKKDTILYLDWLYDFYSYGDKPKRLMEDFKVAIDDRQEWQNNNSNGETIKSVDTYNSKARWKYLVSGENNPNNEVGIIDGKWIYYSDYKNGGMFKIKTDGSKRVRLTNVYPSHMAKKDDYLFFTKGVHLNNGDTHHIWKVKTDGTDYGVVDGTSYSYANHPFVYKDYLYYNIGYRNINRKKIDESRSQMLIKPPRHAIGVKVFDGSIYFSHKSDNYSLYRSNLDGSHPMKLNDHSSTDFYVSGDEIYYVNRDDSSIYCINYDYEIVKVVDEVISRFSVIGEWVYYTNEKDGKIYKVKKDGTGKTVLSNERSYIYGAFGDWLLCKTDKQNLYLIKTDGTIRYDFDDVPIE